MLDDNDKRAFLEQMIIDDYEDLKRFASRVVYNSDLAQDLVQETFLIAQNKIDDLMNSPSPRGWLFITLKNVVKNANRRQQVMLTALTSLTEYVGSQDMTISLALKYRGTIDEGSLKLLEWVYCDGWSYKEVADKLGISLPACKKRIYRARADLKLELEQLDIEE